MLSRPAEKLQGRRLGSVERVQSELRRRGDSENAKGEIKFTQGWHTVPAAEGDQVVRQRESVPFERRVQQTRGRYIPVVKINERLSFHYLVTRR